MKGQHSSNNAKMQYHNLLLSSSKLNLAHPGTCTEAWRDHHTCRGLKGPMHAQGLEGISTHTRTWRDQHTYKVLMGSAHAQVLDGISTQNTWMFHSWAHQLKSLILSTFKNLFYVSFQMKIRVCHAAHNHRQDGKN